MRTCGICRRAPREGEVMLPVRVVPEDFSPEVLTKLQMKVPAEAGLYHACADCVRELLPAIVARVNKTMGSSYTVDNFPQNHLI